MSTQNDNTTTVRLSDGRRLAYRIQGTRESPALIWFDGTPGSRLTTLIGPERFDKRIISFDRPGYGNSDPHPGRTVADVASDVAQLADHLQLRTWVAVGYSGGGPHALACGALLPGNVTAVGLVATVSPPGELADWNATAPPESTATLEALAADPNGYDAQLAEMREALLPDPVAGLVAAIGSGGTEADQAFLSEPTRRDMFNASLREALRPGHRGWLHDEIALHGPWGFRLADVGVPVHFLHGAADPIAPLTHATTMAQRIPTATITVIDDVGHLAVLDHLHRLTAITDPLTTDTKEPT